MRVQAAQSMSRLADHLHQSDPGQPAHQHVRDAARMLRAGNEEAAQRHLRAAIFSLTPQSLMRQGLHTDDAHNAARGAMHGVHRHLLLVKDIADTAEKNRAAIRRDSGGDNPAPLPPRPPVQPDPNAGFGPGALAQKPTVRQPPGDRALNAPPRTNSGGSDPAVADPNGPQPAGSRQFAYGWDDLAAVIELANRPKVIELVGPHGFIHDWIFIGVPGPGQEVSHPQHGHGVVTSADSGHVQVSFDSGHSASFPVRAQQGPGHFEQMTDAELGEEYNRSQGSRLNAVVSELDRRDQRDEDTATQEKARRVSALYAEQPKTEADQNRVYQGLVNEGESAEDAWAHTHGTNAGAMARQSAIQQLRTQGYTGSGFDALTRAAYKDDIRRRTVMAENATNGYMLSPAGKKAGIEPYSLFTGPESRARKYASPELKEWFDQNGRPTAADFQAQMTGQKTGTGPRDFYASVTWDDLARVVELTGDGHGNHVAGTQMVYGHGWRPLSGSAVGKDGIRRPGGTGERGKAGGIFTNPHPASKLTVSSNPRAAAENALRGDAAYGHVPEPAGKKEQAAADYYSVASGRLNPALRSGTRLTDKTDRMQVRNLESAFAKAPPTTQHIVAYRGTTGALFGKGDATGTQFTDKGFTSVSADQKQAGMFGSEADPALMEIHVPAGSRVVKPGAAGHYSEGDDAEKELVLNHGGRYEITSDQMVSDPELGQIRKLTATYRGSA
jgi:hypothetical protein